MIDGYYKRQTMRGVLAMVTLLATIAFVRIGSGYAMHNLNVGTPTLAWVISLFLTSLVFSLGYLHGKRGKGHHSYEDTGMNVGFDFNHSNL